MTEGDFYILGAAIGILVAAGATVGILIIFWFNFRYHIRKESERRDRRWHDCRKGELDQ